MTLPERPLQITVSGPFSCFPTLVVRTDWKSAKTLQGLYNFSAFSPRRRPDFPKRTHYAFVKERGDIVCPFSGRRTSTLFRPRLRVFFAPRGLPHANFLRQLGTDSLGTREGAFSLCLALSAKPQPGLKFSLASKSRDARSPSVSSFSIHFRSSFFNRALYLLFHSSIRRIVPAIHHRYIEQRHYPRSI